MGIMASEISKPADLQKIVDNGEKDIDDYNSFGAGGFFGDGHKAWACVEPVFKSPSLAVKSTEVFTKDSVGYSIKLSDSDGKLSLLKTTDNHVDKQLKKVVENSQQIKNTSNIDISKMETNPLLQYRTEADNLQELMEIYYKVADELYPSEQQSAGTRRRTRKRSKRTKRRSQRKQKRSQHKKTRRSRR